MALAGVNAVPETSSATRAQGIRTLISLVSVLVLLLVALTEAISSGEAALALGTLFGIPGVCFVFRGLRWVIRSIERADLFSPLVAFPIIYVLWFGVGSLTFWEDANPPRYEYFVMGLLSYLAGALTMRRKGAATGEACGSESASWSALRFRLVVYSLFFLMTGSYVMLIAQIGIPTIHDDVAFRRAALSSHHYLGAILQSSATTLMLFSAADLWSHKRTLAPATSIGVIVLGALFLASFGNKGFVIIPLLTLLILRHYWKKAIPGGRFFFVSACLFLISVGYDYTRAMAVNEMEDTTWDEMLYTAGAFTLYTNLSNFRDIVQAIPSEVPYQHGYLTFGVLLQTLPGHHESSDEFFRRILGSDFIGGGQPGTVLAPFYGDFGVTGILLGMFLFGAFSAKTYGWTKEKPTFFRVLLYSWLAQTAILSVYGALVTYIITLWLPFMWWVLHRWMSTPAEITDFTDAVPGPSLASI